MQQNVGTQIIGLIWNMYKETFEMLSFLQCEIDWVSVDYKTKLFMMKELFSGNADHVRC
jgi:hypothetical protein